MYRCVNLPVENVSLKKHQKEVLVIKRTN